MRYSSADEMRSVLTRGQRKAFDKVKDIATIYSHRKTAECRKNIWKLDKYGK